MNRLRIILAACLLLPQTAVVSPARQWTLRDCIDYALQNNITLQKTTLARQSAEEDVLQSRAALLPSLSASTGHNATWRPWPETGSATVTGGYAVSSVDKVYYNGSYAVSGNWTVWNGNRNRNAVRLNEMAVEQARLDSAVTANSIQEQITQLYVQILYSNEAIGVNKASLQTSMKNEERGREFVAVGKMSKADLAQLVSQRAQDEYAVVEAESNLRNYKRQLKQLLQITSDDEFDVAVPETTNDMALQTVPALHDVYEQALQSRPEIRNAQLGIEVSDLAIRQAKAQKLPTVGVNASAVTNTTSMSDNAWGSQMKTNFNVGAGFSVSIPLLDNRQTKTAVNKAVLQKQNYQLDLQDKQTALYSTIENYWLQAVTSQEKFKAARVASKSQQTSYDLLSEQFRLGLKNIVELMTGKDNLLMARQNELQSKYMTLLNLHMLHFYQTGLIGE